MPDSILTPDEVLSRYWERGKLPIDLKVIAKEAGIKLEEKTRDTLGDVSGWYKPASNGQPATIEVNVSEPANRIRFTLAHELGHHFLGHEASPRDTTKQFNIYNWDPIEVAANKYAAQLLMPASYVRAAVINKSMTSLNALAKAFGVSTVAMKIRLQELGYIS
ncbi:MAG: ImmA/IrrE family metallo-endopeptidase [Acetobacter cibinongensis]